MGTIWQDISYEYRKGNAVVKLAMLNIAIYVLVNLISVPIYLSGVPYSSFLHFLQEWFYLPSSPVKLLLRPWTLITYMFLHSSIWHLIFNMMVLYWFGRITNDLIHNSKIVPLYFLGGFAGALFFLISFNAFPFFWHLGSVPLVGASAAVMAILLSAATLNPQGHIRLILIGAVELQYVALALVVIDILSIPLTNPGGHFAHLGGALMGWFYKFMLRRGRDLGQPIKTIIGFISNPSAVFRSGPKKKRAPKLAYKKATEPVVTETSGNSSNKTVESYGRSFSQRYRNMTIDECVDAILDKINANGYDNLSQEEKDFLAKSSKKK
jgi:membrane associated rhomboid family serine protease